MSRVEGTAKSHPALLSGMQIHYQYAVPGLQKILTPQDDFLTKIQRELPTVPVRNVYEFLQGCDTHVIYPIEARPESFNFGVINSGNSVFAKIYNGVAIDRQVANNFATRAFPDSSPVLIADSATRRGQRIQEIVAGGLYRDDRNNPKVNPYLYASAEVYTRTVAHLALPHVMHRATALVDERGEAVGFYLELNQDQQITSAQHVAKADVALFADPSRQTRDVGVVSFHQSGDLSPDVAEVIAALRKINVLVYQEKPDDLLNQVLLDEQGRFVTFARLGYLVS